MQKIWGYIYESHKQWEGFIILEVKNHQHLGTCYLPCQTLVKTLTFRGRWTFLVVSWAAEQHFKEKLLSDLCRSGFVPVGLLIPDGWWINLHSGSVLVLVFRKCIVGFSGLAFFMESQKQTLVSLGKGVGMPFGICTLLSSIDPNGLYTKFGPRHITSSSNDKSRAGNFLF